MDYEKDDFPSNWHPPKTKVETTSGEYFKYQGADRFHGSLTTPIKVKKRPRFFHTPLKFKGGFIRDF